MEISGLVVTGLTPDSATITWSTPCPSTSEVHYGLTNRYGQTAMGDGDTTVHSVTLTGLTPRTRYHFRARSETVDTASATSQDRTFVTPAAGEPELDVSLGFDRARSSRELILQVSIRNDGTQDATNVQILRATVTVGLRTRGTTNILPRNLGTIPIGGSVETELKFPLLQGRPGDRAIVKLSGVHDDGSFSKRKRLRIPER
jgi:hypothetical protein